MPEMDGFSLYEKIKKLDAKVIICLLTATDDAYYEILKKNYPNINENCVIHKLLADSGCIVMEHSNTTLYYYY